MRPGDHPEFFRFPAPEGASRESTLRLDREGKFHHEEHLVEHPGLAAALHTWIGRHPDNGRYILSNGYDWTYFTVDDAPFFVTGIRPIGSSIELLLSDGTTEPWRPENTRIAENGALYARVKAESDRGGPFEAKFSRSAQVSLAPFLVEHEGGVAVILDGKPNPIGPQLNPKSSKFIRK